MVLSLLSVLHHGGKLDAKEKGIEAIFLFQNWSFLEKKYTIQKKKKDLISKHCRKTEFICQYKWKKKKKKLLSKCMIIIEHFDVLNL